MKPANVAKKAVKPVLDEAREFVKEVRRQVTGKGSRSEDERPLAVASEKNLTGGSRPEPQQLARLNQFSQQQTDQQLRQLRRPQQGPSWGRGPRFRSLPCRQQHQRSRPSSS